MANTYTYNPQRLRFVHDDNCYKDLGEIIEHISGGTAYDFLQARPHVYAEPMVFKYGDEEDPKVVLAIGAVGDGVQKDPSKNKVLLIDFAGLELRVDELENKGKEEEDKLQETIDLLKKLQKACGTTDESEYVEVSEDEILKGVQSLAEADNALSAAIVALDTKLTEKIEETETKLSEKIDEVKEDLEDAIQEFKDEYDEHVAKSKFNPQETSTIAWNVEEGTVENGTVVTAELKLPEFMDLEARRGAEETKNSLEILTDGHSGHAGLFLNVTVTTEDGKATLWVNNEPHDISTDGKYISNAKYDFETECMIFEYNNGDAPLMVKVEDLINEWKVLGEDDTKQLSNGVVLMRQRVPAGPKDANQYQDILTAKINLAEDDLNMAELVNDTTNSRFGLFVSKQPILDEKERAEQAEETLQSNIDAEVTRAEAKEAELQDAIDAEQARAEQAEEGLQDNIDAEKERAEAAEKTLDEKIDSEVETLNEKIDSEVETLEGKISEEATAREEADNATNKILSKLAETVGANSDGSANPYLVEEINYVTGENVKSDIKSLDNELKKTNESLANEIESCEASDKKLQENIEAEATAREDADEAINTILNALISTVGTKADGTPDLSIAELYNYVKGEVFRDDIKVLDNELKKVNNILDNQITSGEENDELLQGNIDATNAILNALIKTIGANSDGTPDLSIAELYNYVKGEEVKTDIKTLDAELKSTNDNLAQEVTDRVSGDNTLQENIDAEATARENADNTLQENIDAEATRAKDAEAGLADKIANLATTLGANGDGTAKPYPSEIYTYIKGEVVADDLKVLDQTLAATNASLTAEETRATNAEEVLQGNINDEATAREEADTALDTKINELATKFGNVTGENAIVVDADKKVSLKIKTDNFSEKVLSQTEDGLAVKFGLKYERRESAGVSSSDAAFIQLLDANGEMLQEINVSDFIMDGILEDVDLDEAGNLTFTFNEADGKEKKVTINLKDYIQPYENGDGIEITDTTKINVKLDPTTEKFLQVDVYGLRVVGVQDAINATVQAAANAEAAARAEAYNDVVSKITAEKERAEEAESELQVNIDAEAKTRGDKDTELEAKIEEVRLASNTEVTTDAGDHTQAHMEITPSSASDGHPRYTVKLKDVASENALNAEVTRATDAEGVLTDNLAAEVTRAKDAEKVLTDNLAAEVTRATNKEDELENKIELAQKAATTTVEAGQGDNTVEHLTVTESENNSHKVFTIHLNDVASATGLTAEATARENKDNELNAAIVTEQGRATNAEDVLTKGLADEVKRATDKEVELQLNIDAAKAAATSTVISGKLENTTSHLIVSSGVTDTHNYYELDLYDVASATGLTAEIDRATEAENTLTTNLAQEVSDRTKGDADLQKSINDLDAKIDAAAAAATTTVVKGETDMTNAHLTVTEGERDGHKEFVINVLDVASAEGLATEISNRTDADNTLQGNIDAEVTRATTEEGKLQANINAEEAERKSADSEINSKLSNVILALGAQENGSATLYANGETVYVNGQNANVDIKSLDKQLQADETRISNVEKHADDNEKAIADEKNRAETEEARLQGEIEKAANAGKTEIELNSEAETVEHLTLLEHGNEDGHTTYTLGLVDVASQTDITAEAQTRANADNTLQGNIDAEAQTRESADNALQSNIEAEQARAEKAEAKATTEVEKDTEVNTINHLKVTKSYGENVQAVYTIGLVDVASENALNEEVTRAKDAEKTLTDNLANEVTRATEEEAKIRTELANAKQEAQTKVVLDSGYDPDNHMFLTMADTGDTYGQFIYTVGVKDVASATGLTTEIERAVKEEVRIEGRLNDEIKRSTEKDADHDAHLTTLDEGLAAEAKTRGDKDTELENALTAEIDRAVKAEQKAFVSSENTSTVEIIPKYVNDTEKVITANVKRLNDPSNVVQITEGGLYASVTLEYNAAENKLTFNNGLSVQNITLSDHTLVQSAYYDSEEKAIILTVVYADSTKDIKLPVADLVNSIADVNNTLSEAIKELQLKDAEFVSQISDINNSIKDVNTELTLTKNDLEATKTSLGDLTTKFEKEVKDRQDGDTALTDKLNTLTQTVAQNKADASQALTEAVSALNTSIGDTNANLSVLEGTVNNEIKRSTDKDAEHDAAITALQSDLAQEKLDRASAVTAVSDKVTALSGALDSEIATRAANDTRIEGLVTSETTSRQEADANLEKLITANTNKLNTLQETIENKTDDISSIKEALTEEKTAREKDVKKLEELIAEEVKDRENAVKLESDARVSDVNKLNEKIMGVKDAIETTVSESASNLQTSIESAKSDMTAQLGTAKSDLQGQITALDTKLTSAINTAKSDLTTQMGTLQSTLEGKIDTAKTDLQSQITNNKSELQASITSSVNAAKTELNSAISANTKGVSDNKTAIAQLQSDLQAARDRITRLEGQNDILNGQITTLTGQVSSLLSDVAQLKADFARLYNDGYVS